MRTAVHLTEDPSFQVRLQNQKILKSYMADKPFGAGIGTSEYWGKKFSPNTFLANIATDSLYVKIWVETGIIGLFIWLVLILWIIFRGAYLINKIKDKQYKIQLISLWAGLIGIFVANYGNSVMTQFPTLVISYLSIGYIFRVEKDLKKLKNIK
jgi:O-antigen ligase